MKKLFLVIIPLFVCSYSNLSAQAPQEDIVLKAMQDEMKNNLNALRLPGFEKPFFLMYGVIDQKTNVISASLGSLLQSSENQNRFRTTARVLVGDYSFNDESLEDDHVTSASTGDIDLPLNDDYLGIRRSFWSITDGVYRSAARNFEKNKESLKETGKKLEEIPHREFLRGKPVTMITPATEEQFEEKTWGSRMKRLSNLFEGHAKLTNSGVVFNYIRGFKYLANTEGVVIKIPFSYTYVRAFAIAKSDDGERMVNGLQHVSNRPSKLPSEDQLNKEIKALIVNLENQSSLSKFEGEYSGPVLITGKPVADVFSAALMGGNEGIMANDNIPRLKGYQFDMETNSSENSINKNILGEHISVIAKPRLKTFGEVDLLGSFDVDSEGTVPPEAVNVIENGVLKTLLNNRTITKAAPYANGFASGPGVVHVNIDFKNSEKSLKKKLIEAAKRQKLEFGLMIRDNGTGGSNDFYKVYVKDGKEELIRGAKVERISMKTFKRLSGSSENYSAFNLNNADNLQGIISFIVPSAILIDEVDVGRFRVPVLKDEDYVTNPLK